MAFFPRRIVAACAAFLLLAGTVSNACAACICCFGSSLTFAEEMESMDVVAFGTLRELPAPAGPEIPGVESEKPKARFEIDRVIKGEKLAKAKEKIEAIYFGDAQPGQRFLLLAVNDSPLSWSTPIPMTPRGEVYISQLSKLPGDAVTRALFFHDYLHDTDDLMARDAFDELAKLEYPLLVKLKDQMRHDWLVAAIKDKETPASRRRLYLQMLGICGSQADVPLLAGIIDSNNRAERRGMDAVIACYLALQGAEGMELVEERFLRNSAADYADTYAAIHAIRQHARENAKIPPQRRIQALRLMLDRPALADLVIPDLAQLEDWDQMDRLFEMFKAEEPDSKTTFLRIPIINYLRACPLPKADKLLIDCQRLDPKAMRRAKENLPVVIPKPLKFARMSEIHAATLA